MVQNLKYQEVIHQNDKKSEIGNPLQDGIFSYDEVTRTYDKKELTLYNKCDPFFIKIKKWGSEYQQ